jgi:hypothetical protein
MKGDYFDLYQEGKELVRVIAITDTYKNTNLNIEKYCVAIDLDTKLYGVNLDNQVKEIIGNIYE